MTCRGLALLTMLALAAPAADAQPRSLELQQTAPIRVRSGGNELVVLPQAPVAYTRLEEAVADIGNPDGRRAAPIRIVRASPLQRIDYALCVTRDGTLVLVERVYTFDEGRRRYVFTRGDIARSYPSLPEADAWRWLVEMPLSREVTVTLDMRVRARWPVEVVAVAPVYQ